MPGDWISVLNYAHPAALAGEQGRQIGGYVRFPGAAAKGMHHDEFSHVNLPLYQQAIN